MDKLKALYESYVEQGLLSKETSFEQFSQSDTSIQEALYKQGIDEKIISSETTFDVFSSVWGEKKNQVVTPSDVVEEVTESTTETEITPGSLDSSGPTPIEIPVVEEEEEIVFDETTPENQELLVKNQYNIDLLNSVGYIEANEGFRSLIELEGLSDFDKSILAGREKSYRLKDPETGKFDYKKESEIKPEIIEAIKTYETSRDDSYKKNYTDVQVDVEDFDRDDVPDASKLDLLGINQEDYLKWDKVNTRQEGSVFKFMKRLLTSEEGDEFEKEQRQYEKLQAYQATQLNGITNDLEKNQAKQKLTSNPEQIKVLKKEEKNLQKEFYSKVQVMSRAIDLFPKFKEKTVDKDLEKRKRLYYAVKEGGLTEASQGTIELLRAGGTALSDFSMNFLGGIPAFIDQRLATIGYDKKGFLAGLSDMFTDSAEHVDLEYGAVKRSGFMSGKPVTYRGQQYFVDKNGKVYDTETNILMDGIIPLSDVKEIQKRSKDVPEEETMWTGGSVTTGLTSTLVNLFGLIRTGGKVKNTLGLKGKRAGSIGMGVTSFTSGVVDNVDDIRSQLIATGMSEKEAMDIAVNAGQAISTLDGVFSGLAGSNEKLLTGLTGIKNQIKNLAVTKGKDFTAKELKTKSYELIKENAKELFVEELPVLFSEKGINYLVNRNIGQNVLDSKITKENIIETAVMTIGATSTLGSRKLLSGNKRADLVRTIAADIGDLQGTLDALVKEGSLTKKEASNAYTEIYSMQTAENLTKGTILVSENMETASDLLIQRQNLINQKEGLEGPGKQNIDNKIADVDAQLDALYARDKEQAKAIVDGEQDGEVKIEVTKEEALESLKSENEVRKKAGLPVVLESDENILKQQEQLLKEKQDAIQKPSTEKQVLPDDAGSKEEGRDSEVGLQQVGEGDTQQVTTDTQVEEGKTETDTTSDKTAETDTEQVSILNKSINVTDSRGRKGLVPVSELESFVGENRLGDAAMPNSRETIDKLKEDIKKNGFKEPIVVLYDKFSNGGEATIIEGNHRYAAAKELGLKEIPVTFEKGTIRSNEKRAKDQMFPLNRKLIGKINDTRGVKGSDLGLTVRQPTDIDFVQDTEQVTQPSEVVYEMNKTDKNIWSKDFEIIDNRNGLELGKDAGKWVVYNRVTGESVDAKSKKDAKDIVNNAPAYAGIFGDGTTVDSEMIVTPSTKTKKTDTEQLTEPSAVMWKDDLSGFVRMEDGSYTDGDQIYENLEELRKAAESEGTELIDMPSERENEFRTSEAVIELENEIKKSQPTSTEEGMSVNKERVDSIVDGIIQKTKDRSVKGEQTNPQKLADNAIEYLKGSKLFEQATDTERETILRDVSKKLGVEIKAPTAKKLLGIKRIGKPKTITVKSDYAAMKKDLQKEAKVARDAKNDVNKRRKGLQGAIDLVLKAGNITTKKANSLLKKVSNVNLYNAKKVQDVIDFTERAMNDAEYSNKLEKANKLQKTIKKKLKGKEAGLSDAAKEFTKVNPSNVSDIDNYLEKAEAVNKGLTPTRKPSKGELKVTKPFDIKKITEYSKKEVEAESKRNYELAKESFQQLTGTEAGDLTLEEIRENLNRIDGKTVDPEAKAEFEKEKKKTIDKAVDNAFKNTKINIKGAIESGDIKVTKAQKTLINNFLNMDLNIMSTEAKMKALDAIVNFELNQSPGGMEAALSRQIGNLEMIRVKDKNIKSSEKSTSLGRLWNKTISTLPNAFELVFGSQQKARAVMKAMGVDGVINGSAKAQTEASNAENDYAKAFAKKKMQQGIYFDVSNDMQRGILGEIRRVAPGTEAEQQAEFEKSKKLIKETYETLLKSSDKIRQRKGKAIKEQYEKVLKDSKTIAEVESKADPVNLQGVEYVTDLWAKKYPELADVSLNVYNRNLGDDINYTPRSFQKLKEDQGTRDITEPMFDPSGRRKNAYDKEAGVLKPATKPSTLPQGRVLDLGFDYQNINNYKSALTDLYTASSIQQIKGARESKAFNDIFTNEGSRDIINDRINNYVDAKRGKNYLDKKQKRFLRRLNKVATLGVARVLGGPTQVIKQIVPIFNTSVNAGPINTIKSIGLILNKDVRDAIKNSGLPIANRGIKSQGDIEGVDTKIKKKGNTAGGRLLDSADQLNKATLQAFLVTPDVMTAQASFIAYYLDAMNKKGVKSNDIDFTKPLDKESAQYAQQQVDRQQNTSDQDLQGELFTDQSATKQILRKTLFPFANFLLNQKTRMYSDINTLFNKTTLPGDKTRAAKSLGGLAVETVAFNAIGLGITQMLSSIARSFSGEEEDDPNLSSFKNRQKRKQAKEKEFKSRVTGRLGNMLADVAVPVPVLNDVILDKVNGLMGLFQEDEDNPFKFFANTDKELLDQLGVLGIGGKKAGILYDMIKTIKTGEFSGEAYGSKYSRKIDPKAIDKLKLVAVAYAMHSIGVPGLNTSEVGYISERAFKNITKITEAKEKKYNIEKDAIDRLIERGIFNPSDEAIKREKKEIRRKAKAQQ